ncbi:hypothetical protein K458DRAFT_384604 [Lentithecium fluviatile CBS 122367]|uniref:Uncharacterized protein n=1 Tax=Lentithecium fluviatile CBS 122367 TaxID=1168545 RepID=A0A6G1JE63_9PLEO|nr:hypothetical protein K458DRAFT_384604 [Lentithecium fluviatile CBS 122367]
MKRAREDVQIWRARLFGRRIVTPDREIAAFDSWKNNDNDWVDWEPRVYFSRPVGDGLEKSLKYKTQANSMLLQLPAEIRTQILDLVLAPEMISQKTNVGGMEQGDAVWMNTSAIIFTCKQLYAEGRALAVDKHTFPYEKFPKKTKLCATGGDDCWYNFDRLNVVCDRKTNVIKRAFYR